MRSFSCFWAPITEVLRNAWLNNWLRVERVCYGNCNIKEARTPRQQREWCFNWNASTVSSGDLQCKPTMFVSSTHSFDAVKHFLNDMNLACQLQNLTPIRPPLFILPRRQLVDMNVLTSVPIRITCNTAELHSCPRSETNWMLLTQCIKCLTKLLPVLSAFSREISPIASI